MYLKEKKKKFLILDQFECGCLQDNNFNFISCATIDLNISYFQFDSHYVGGFIFFRKVGPVAFPMFLQQML